MTVPYPDRRFAAFLFDMDGTIVTSIASANRAWTNWARTRGIDPAHVISIMHGVRTIETMRTLGVDDPEGEAARLTAIEIADTEGLEALPGAAAFLASLPADRWAIATSAGRALAEARLKAAGLPLPAVVVTSEDVERGKPDPTCFRLAAERLGFAAADCLVFEDTRAGIDAAHAAGAAALVLTATHDHPLDVAAPAVADYRGLAVDVSADGLAMIAA